MKIYGIKLNRDAAGCFSFSVVHSGKFRLQDYQAIVVEANAVKLIPRDRCTVYQ